MARFAPVTDDDLERARRDASFRRRLLADNLGLLIEELQRQKRRAARRGENDTARLREGAELAVKLADMISRVEPEARADPDPE